MEAGNESSTEKVTVVDNLGTLGDCRTHLRIVPPKGKGAGGFVLQFLTSLAEDCSGESQLSWHLCPNLWKVAFAPAARENPLASCSKELPACMGIESAERMQAGNGSICHLKYWPRVTAMVSCGAAI